MYRLCFFSSDFYALFPVEKLLQELQRADPLSTWYLCSTIGFLVGMCDSELELFHSQHIREADKSAVLTHVFEDMHEFESIRAKFFREQAVGSLEGVELSPMSVNLAGVVLPHASLHDSHAEPYQQAEFMHTKSTEKVFHEIAIGISSGLPILLQGFQGVGKTSIVEEAARMIGSSGTLF
jgi:ABC-type transport system involved in cytochrome bd biosynthesis fused ATPase/permease subunit